MKYQPGFASSQGVKKSGLDAYDVKTTNRTRGAGRVAAGGALRLGQSAVPTRIAQGRRVGEF